MPFGGGAVKAFFRVKRSDHTKIIAADTSTVLATETAATAIVAPDIDDAALVLYDDATSEKIVESTGIKYDDNGVGTITYSQSNCENTLWTFLETACAKSKAAASTKNELTSEAGTKIGGSGGASEVSYLLIDKGPSVAADSGVLTHMAIVTIKKTSGGVDYKSGDAVKPSFEVTTIACNTEFAIPQACFDPDHWGTISAGDRTIPVDYYVKTKNLAAAA